MKSFLFHPASPAAQAGNWSSTPCTPVSEGAGVGLLHMGRGAPGEGESQPWVVGLLVLLFYSRPAKEVHMPQRSYSAKIRMSCPNLLLCLWPLFFSWSFRVLNRLLPFLCFKCESWRNSREHKIPGFPDIFLSVWVQTLSKGGIFALLQKADNQIQGWVGGQVSSSSLFS